MTVENFLESVGYRRVARTTARHGFVQKEESSHDIAGETTLPGYQIYFRSDITIGRINDDSLRTIVIVAEDDSSHLAAYDNVVFLKANNEDYMSVVKTALRMAPERIDIISPIASANLPTESSKVNALAGPVIDIKRIRPESKLPTYGSNQAAGMDLYADIDEATEVNYHTP